MSLSLQAGRRSPAAGFTLIELLVVIAIIGLLSSIVLASLTSAREKGINANIRSNLTGARAQAEIFYDANGNKYTGTTANGITNLCSSNANAGGTSGIYDQVKAAADQAGVTLTTGNGAASSATRAVCNACPTSGACNPKNSWAASVPLKGGGHFCVDSTGYAGTPTNFLGRGDTYCAQ